jgi:asparagine N-glycosylation enzyme membrane subunit Stt3
MASRMPLVSLVLDMGESLQAFLCSLGIFIVLLLLIILRRPAEPSKLDLLLVGWGLPILFFALLFAFPVAWRLRGLS